MLAWRSGVIATGLAACVWLYDAVLKDDARGAGADGRMPAAECPIGHESSPRRTWRAGTAWATAGTTCIVAGGIGCLVAGVTWFARGEAETSSRGQLLLARW